MGGKKNRKKTGKAKKMNEDGSQPLDASFISSAANDSFIETTSPDVKDVEPVTVTPEVSSVAKEGGDESVSVSIIYLRFFNNFESSNCIDILFILYRTSKKPKLRSNPRLKHQK